MRTMLRSTLVVFAAATVLSACGDTDDTYYSDRGQAARDCSARGYKPATKEYDNCVSEEVSAQRLDALHEERDRYQQEVEDYRNGRYNRY